MPAETRERLIRSFDVLRSKEEDRPLKSMATYRYKRRSIIMINEKRLLDEFLELVQIDSETKHEEKIVEVLKKNFRSLV